MVPRARSAAQDAPSPHEQSPYEGLSDEQYQRILSAVRWSFLPKERGRPRTTDLTRIIEALLYKAQTGCRWRRLPAPPRFPPWQTVYNYYRAFQKSGEWATLQKHLLQAAPESGRTPRSPSRPDWAEQWADRDQRSSA